MPRFEAGPVGMSKTSKLDFLRRVSVASARGTDDPIMAYDTYMQDNVRIAAQALQLRLIRLVPDPEGLGYQVRVTPAGRLLASDQLHEAAVALNSDFGPGRLSGEAPLGPIGARLSPGALRLPVRRRARGRTPASRRSRRAARPRSAPGAC